MTYRNRKKGFSLIETMVYVALVVVVMTVIVGGVVNIMEAHREVARYEALLNAGITTINRIAYEVRDANVLDKSKSSFATSSGALVVVKESEVEVATTTKFYVGAGRTIKVEQTLSSAEAPPVGPGSGGHHDSCNVNSDCSVSYPVCCAVPSHGPDKVCETNQHHGGICGIGIPAGTTTASVLIAGGASTVGDVYTGDLTFWDLSSTNSQAIRIGLTITASSGPRQISASFFDTVVLRGSYR